MRKLLPAGYVVAFVFLTWILATLRTAPESNYASMMSSLSTEVEDSLVAYFRKHKRYTGRLTELPIQTFKYNDGGSPDRLNDFIYRARGAYFALTW
jgi:hypothetical protein